MKRGFDFFLSAIGLIVLSPIFLMLSLAMKIFDRGPILFKQQRVGHLGRPFRMLKFRTMIVNAEKKGGAITVVGDKRITSIGKILRATKADELPQLWNVLKGEMSFVGPRPEVAQYVALYTEEQREVLKLKPGITDLASFAFFDEAELLSRSSDPEKFYRDVVMPEKIRINLAYANQAGLVSDLYLIAATVLRAFGVNNDLFARWKIAPPHLEAKS